MNEINKQEKGQVYISYYDRSFNKDLVGKMLKREFCTEFAMKLIGQLNFILTREPLDQAPAALNTIWLSNDPARPPFSDELFRKLEGVIEQYEVALGRLRAINYFGFSPTWHDDIDPKTNGINQLAWENDWPNPLMLLFGHLRPDTQPLGVLHGLATLIGFEHDEVFDFGIGKLMPPSKKVLEGVRGFRDQATLAIQRTRETIAYLEGTSETCQLFDTKGFVEAMQPPFKASA